MLEQFINSNQDKKLGNDIFVAENALSKFFAAKKENKVNTRKINNMFLDEILAQTEKERWNTESTRHKSRNGETHTEVPKFDNEDAWNYLPRMLGRIDTSKFAMLELKEDSNEGIKETEGKLNYELDWEFIEQMAQRMNQNKGKYPPYNWTKDMDVEKLKQSLFRHVIQVMQGNYSDDGRPFGHWESIALNAMMINYQLKLQNQK